MKKKEGKVKRRKIPSPGWRSRQMWACMHAYAGIRTLFEQTCDISKENQLEKQFNSGKNQGQHQQHQTTTSATIEIAYFRQYLSCEKRERWRWWLCMHDVAGDVDDDVAPGCVFIVTSISRFWKKHESRDVGIIGFSNEIEKMKIVGLKSRRGRKVIFSEQFLRLMKKFRRGKERNEDFQDGIRRGNPLLFPQLYHSPS